MSSSSGWVRSKNGCITCKKRRKKCDEARPTCERCAKAGMQCLGYESTNSDSRPVRIRPRGATRVTLSNSRNSSSPRLSSSTPAITSPPDSISGSQSHEFARPHLSLVHNDGSIPSAEDPTQAISEHSQTETPVANDVFDFSFMSPPLSGFSFGPRFGGDPSTWDANLLSNFLGPWVPGPQSEGAGSLSLSAQATAQPATPNLSDGQQISLALYKPPYSPDTSKRMTSGQVSLLNALFSLGHPTSDRITPTPSSSYSTAPSTNGSTWPSPDTEHDQETETSEDSDPEGVTQIVCGTPTLEPTVQSNSLPFVLFNYATMATRTMYEPLKMAGLMRDWITERFNRSDESRAGITILANAFHTIWNTRTSAADYVPIVAGISTQLRQKMIQASSTLGLAAQNEVQKTRSLSEALEIINLQMHAGSLRTKLEMMAETAPLFRSACPEAPHELIDLPAKLTHPDSSLWHFVVIDVILSAITLRPMQFRYHTQFDGEFPDREDIGMQWFHGIPGEFILIMARINMILFDYWANVDPGVITEIEQQLNDFKATPGKSPDAYLMVARVMVQECWRLAMLIYLYMCLCSADAKDPRVERAQKSFMRVLDRTKPSRTPDVFLLGPLNIVGRVTSRPREREIVRQRLLNLQECSHPGTCGHDAVLILEGVWARSDAEGRPAVWRDARIATSAVCGI